MSDVAAKTDEPELEIDTSEFDRVPRGAICPECQPHVNTLLARMRRKEREKRHEAIKLTAEALVAPARSRGR